MKTLPDNCVDLIIADPPYNIKKAEWDKWKSQEDYLSWMMEWIGECERVLKDNGSFYWFHNQMPVISRLMCLLEDETSFVFKQLIVWNKRFVESPRKWYFDNVIKSNMDRNYRSMAEYLLFYTFQDETGLTTVKLDLNNFTTLRQYFKDFQEALGLAKKEIVDLIGQCADHPFRWGSSQWDMPTPETYQQLCELPLKNNGFIRREYEDLRREYEDLRYTFNNQKTHHSIWNYEITPKQGHVTPKPLLIIENIIKHSSNPQDTILDPFMGSGTTAHACKNLNRNYIGYEITPTYFNLIKERLKNVEKPLTAF
jgi:site-specific DNA-methyltransferase (adenine-specific)